MAIFYNQATLSYNDTVTNSNIVTGEIVETLTVTKTALTDSYTADELVTYAVSIVNTGTAAVNSVTLTDDLGAYDFGGTTLTPLDYADGSARLFIGGVLQPAPVTTAGPPLVFSGFSIPGGESALIVYQARVNGFAPLGVEAEVTNTVSATAAGITEPVTASETIAADIFARLTITKSLSPEVVSENGQLTYTFVIQNIGSNAVTAADNAVVTDDFSPVLSDITVSFNGVTWTEPANYTYNEATGLFSTAAGQITVPAATYTQDPVTGEWITIPGVSVLRVTGTV